MELYTFSFGALALVSIALAYHRHRADRNEKKETLALPAGDGKAAASKFQLEYFGVYGLVVAADWLQVSNHNFPYATQTFWTDKDSRDRTCTPCIRTRKHYRSRK